MTLELEAKNEMEVEAFNLMSMEKSLGKMKVWSREYESASDSFALATGRFEDKFGKTWIEVFNSMVARATSLAAC